MQQRNTNQLPVSLCEAGVDSASHIHSYLECYSIKISENTWKVFYLEDDPHGENPLEICDGEGAIVVKRDDPSKFYPLGEDEYGREYPRAIEHYRNNSTAHYKEFDESSVKFIASQPWIVKHLLLEKFFYEEQDKLDLAELYFEEINNFDFDFEKVDLPGISEMKLEQKILDSLWEAAMKSGAFGSVEYVFLREQYMGGYEIADRPEVADAYWDPEGCEDWISSLVEKFRYAKIKQNNYGVEEKPRWVLTPHGGIPVQCDDYASYEAAFDLMKAFGKPAKTEEEVKQDAMEYAASLILSSYNAWATGSMYCVCEGTVTLEVDEDGFEEYSFEVEDCVGGYYSPHDALVECESRFEYYEKQVSKKETEVEEMESV